jgi:soluble lytic murein transglycosylase
LAPAANTAGPARPRRWREGGVVLEPAAWAECIPFNETRDYVKKVLSNSVYYGALLAAPAVSASGSAQANPPGAQPSLKARLGPPIGPREPGATVPDRELP